jgi:hypothetical protein
MFGVPSGVVWDPAGDGEVQPEWLAEGYLPAAADISQARPPMPTAPPGSGAVEGIWVVRGLDLNRLVGHEFQIGSVRCRGMRLCEPCTVVQRYVGRPLLRDLVHRGGLRADILADGEIHVGDTVRAVAAAPLC